MIKVLAPGSFGFDQPIFAHVKVASGGLRGVDRAAFLKRAGHDFLPHLDKLRRGEVPVHLLAVGSYEHYGANRNGDGFKCAACRDYHDTFEKTAHYFRDHRNKKGDLRYGRVVKSAFNEPMGRIELLVGLFGDPEAARAGGGDLGRVADKELEKVAAGRDVPVSMSCTVPFDVCSECGHRARNRDEYCDTKMVKLAGGATVSPCSGFGARHGLTKVAASGRRQHVDNPYPSFFDISGVYRNADPIAFALGKLEKSASAAVLSGADLAIRLGVTAPVAGDLTKRAARRALVADLADREVRGDRGLDGAFAKRADAGDPPACLREFPVAAPAAFAALAEAGVCLDPRDWLTLVMGKAAAAEAGAALEARLPGVFGRLAVADDDELDGDLYDHGRGAVSTAWRRWATKQAATRGTGRDDVRRRVEAAALHGATPPPRPMPAACDEVDGAEKLARQYARYQLAFLESQPADSGELGLIRSLLVRQNAVT